MLLAKATREVSKTGLKTVLGGAPRDFSDTAGRALEGVMLAEGRPAKAPATSPELDTEKSPVGGVDVPESNIAQPELKISERTQEALDDTLRAIDCRGNSLEQNLRVREDFFHYKKEEEQQRARLVGAVNVPKSVRDNSGLNLDYEKIKGCVAQYEGVNGARAASFSEVAEEAFAYVAAEVDTNKMRECAGQHAGVAGRTAPLPGEVLLNDQGIDCPQPRTFTVLLPEEVLGKPGSQQPSDAQVGSSVDPNDASYNKDAFDSDEYHHLSPRDDSSKNRSEGRSEGADDQEGKKSDDDDVSMKAALALSGPFLGIGTALALDKFIDSVTGKDDNKEQDDPHNSVDAATATSGSPIDDLSTSVDLPPVSAIF